MERFFIVTNDKYLKALDEYRSAANKQGKFVDEFFKENNIAGSRYYVGGDGFVNHPFMEHQKDAIMLFIEPSEENKNTLGRQLLTKLHPTGLVGFRKTSKILKDFQQKCIDNAIVINLHKPRVGDYIDRLWMNGYSHQQFMYDDKLYLMVSSNDIGDLKFPDGFDEIKGSEYHKVLEEYREKSNR